MLSSVAMALPLMDYSKGKAAVDLTFRNSEVTCEGTDSDKKSKLDLSITYSLGNDAAIQYRHFAPEMNKDSLYITGDVSTNEFNYLRKIDKNVLAFVGIMSVDESAKQTVYSSHSEDYSSTFTQLGIIGSTKLSTKTTLWGALAVGSDSMTNLEVGLSYEIAPKLELNVNYRDMKFNINDNDLKVKGTGVGITYKF